jgi:phosphatidylserine decarboxylase
MIAIARGGFPWILGSFAVTFILFSFCFLFVGPILVFFSIVSLLSLLISCLLIVFFRDPFRITGDGVVAVADGKIREISHIDDPDVGDCIKVSTFMNIQNVHVNRMPFDGSVKKITHYSGGHIPAFKKDSDVNERVVLLLQTSLGVMKVVQIAGTLARRIVPYVNEDDVLKKGEKIGLIRLGSRVDVYLPANGIKELMIQMHSKIKAGEDTIAEINV